MALSPEQAQLIQGGITAAVDITKSGFQYGQQLAQLNYQQRADLLNQTTNLASLGWGTTQQLAANNAGLSNAIMGRYGQPRSFMEQNSWLPWAIAGAVAFIVILIIVRR